MRDALSDGQKATQDFDCGDSVVSNHWLAVASAEHVRRGRAEGFMQVSHGKLGPLRRILPNIIFRNDVIAEAMGVKPRAVTG